MLEFDGGQYLGVGLSFGAGPAEPLGRPEPEPLVATREGLEPDPLVVNELPLESLFALVERRHGRPPFGGWSHLHDREKLTGRSRDRPEGKLSGSPTDGVHSR